MDNNKTNKDTASQEINALKKRIGEMEEAYNELNKAFRENEERLKLASVSAHLGLWDHNHITHKVVRSKQWAEMLGYTLDEIEKNRQTWLDLIHPDDLPHVYKTIEEHENNRSEEFKVEHRMKTKSGEWKWILNWGKIVERDKDGNPIRAAGIHLDITEQKLKERRRLALSKISEAAGISDDLYEFLKIVHEQLDTLMDVTKFCIALYDKENEKYSFPFYQDADDSPENYSQEQLNDGFIDYVRRRNKPLLADRKIIKRLAEQNEAKMVGKMAWSWLGVPLKTAPDTTGIMIVYSYDEKNIYTVNDLETLNAASEHVARYIERKQAADAINKSEEKYRNLVNQAKDGIAIIQDGIMKFISPVLADILGYDIEEVIGKIFTDYVAPEEIDKVQDYYRRRLSGEDVPQVYESAIIHKNGELINVEYNTNIISYGGGKATLAIVRDITKRKQTEAALHESQERNRIMLETMNEGFGIQDEKDIMTYVNDRFCEIIGYAKDELIGRPATDFLDNDNQKILLEQTARREKRKGEKYDLTWIKNDGSEVHTIISPAALRDLNGNYAGSFASITDITDRKLAEEALKESEEKFFKAFHTNAAVMTISTLDGGRIVEVNDLFLKIWKCTREEVIGKSTRELGFWTNDSQRNTIIQAIKNKGYINDFEIIARTKEGKLLTGLFSADIIYLKDRQFLLSVVNDITDRKKAEEELKESEEKFRRIAEGSFDVIYMTDLNGNINYISPAVKRLFGFEPEEIIGTNVVEFASETDRSRLINYLKEITKGEIVESQEFEIYKKDGTPANFEVNANPIYKDSEIIGVQAVGRDVTETKRLRELESRTQRLETAGQIAGQVAHDFNNLLAPLTAFPDLIKAELASDNPAVAYIDYIKNAATQIAEINQQLLTLGRRGRYTQETLNPNTVLQQSIKQLETPPATLVIITAFDKNLKYIKGGKAQLLRVFVNILNNAREAMQDIGKITIKSENLYTEDVLGKFSSIPKGKYIKITISDSGTGISKNNLQKIFDPFFTTKTADRKRGSGLGLSVVDAVIKDHNGYLDLESVEGRGTSIYLYFPITREPIKDSALEKIVGGTETILVVDDDKIQRDVALELLGKLGYTATAVKCGEDAIKYIRKTPQDLLILDMIIQGIDGVETYRQALEINPNQKAIIVSGYAESDKIKTVLEMGAGAFIRKPLTRRSIALAVRNELDKK